MITPGRAGRSHDTLNFIEVVMGSHDAPQSLKELAKAFAAQNAYGSTVTPA